jgi:hypothetical protein
MRDYDPEKDGWVHRVTPRADRFPSGDLCHNGRDHEFASGECVHCLKPDPYQDRPAMVHAYDTRNDHICFAGCRHARTPDGRYLRNRPPDFDDLYPDD